MQDNRNEQLSNHQFAVLAGQLRRTLFPYRQRLIWRQLWRGLWLGLLVGLALAATVVGFSWLTPFPHSLPWGLSFLGLSVLGGMVWAVWRLPGLRAAAAAADSMGLKDRAVTALELVGGEKGQRTALLSPFIQLQITDAVDHLENSLRPFGEAFPLFRIRSKEAALAGITCLLLAAFIWLPNPMDEQVRQMELVEETLEEQAASLEETAKKEEQNEDSGVGKATKEALEKLARELAAAKDPTEALKTLARGEQELEKLRRQVEERAKDLQDLFQSLAGEPSTRKIGQALNQGDSKSLREALDEFRQAMNSLKPEEKDRLAGKLEHSATRMEKSASPGDVQAKELAQKLQQAARSLREGEKSLAAGTPGGDSESLADALQQAQKMAQNGSGTASRVAWALAQIQGAKNAMMVAQGGQSSGISGTASGGTLAQAGSGQSSAGQSNSSSGAANGSSGQGISSSQVNSNGSNSGNNSSSGNGSGSGSGNGSGSGSGRGSGSGSGQGGGAGLGGGSHELVNVPEKRIGGSEPQDTAGGPVTPGGQLQDSQQSMVLPGAVRPYREVYQEYAQHAREAVQRQDLPPVVQSVVRDYFTRIEPQ